MNGLTMRGLAGTSAPGRGEIEAALRRVLTPNPALHPAEGRGDGQSDTLE